MTVNPYDIQPMQPKGSPQASLFRAVGRSLSAWEYMEYELSKLYDGLLGAQTFGAVAGYGTLISAAARLELVVQAAGHFPVTTERFTSDLPDLLKQVGRFMARRNDIAHGVVSKVKDREGWYLIPAWYDTRKSPIGLEKHSAKFNFGVGRYAYTVEQVDEYAVQFHSLREQASVFVLEAQTELHAWLEALREQDSVPPE